MLGQRTGAGSGDGPPALLARPTVSAASISQPLPSAKSDGCAASAVRSVSV